MNSTKANTIYLQLKKDILNYKYKIGDIINEQSLAEKYNVSKTPVREALTALVQDGCLVKYPRRGYFIKEINFNEYNQLLQYRYLIENGIAQYIISKCTDEQIDSLTQYTPEISVTFEEFQEENKKFHMAMSKITGNKYMINALQGIFDQSIRDSAYSGYEKLKNDVHKDHRAIVDALKSRDYDLARKMIAYDLKRSDENNTFF